jgi:large subunit ribosomal protein L23
VNADRLYSVLIRPRISEKAARIQAKHNQYVFQVAADATRGEVKEAVETLFKVKVNGVQVLNVKGKAKGFRGRPGQRSGWRKAYVTLADGQSIDFGVQP